ncbi:MULTISPECIES: peptidoglycan DD-metalloendopeptidase family protein [unclassified Pseudoalteromonas]|uniref:murein hydrolase activator EnvC family protein n=1 Tax=unclassified Pseudoalteromonas TaxID=194690 RepID=UPI000C07B3BD|nr:MULTISPECIES: peptidoglycan DD-metalloendopeptidase family protein [unclassified Pseudoalteromonas]MDP2636640.1 peptidoglycan DD-metalloendopeptidase family protein [Pseudoalteromonas sp. 1_MG-2023]PHN91019.1 protease [Pseudoalteromonas sp. 3D05]
MTKSVNLFIISLLILTSFAIAPATANEDRTKKDLSEIQNALKQSEADLAAQRKDIAKLQQTLKAFELNIAKNAKALSIAKQSIKETEAQQATQQRQANKLKQQQQKLQRVLAAQLKSAYMSGGNDYAKMLLNQQNTAQVERTLSYYNYLNKARIKQIEELKALMVEIEAVQAELEQSKKHLIALHQEQKSRHQALVDAQKQRKSNISELKAKLDSTKGTINYLKENEKTLVTTLQELEKEKNQTIELIGLQSSKGRLNWPTKGKLAHRFGQRKHSGINWKGVLISANEGNQVSSIHNGQVVYADWLKGYGWVIVVDHGEGFMSLYGHTQTLLKDVGDTVRKGDIIALVGQSGGQANSGLYFELRHKGRAVNPVKWCRRI